MFKQICIIGTTASGKTDLAMQVATKFDCIILSLDSLCIYKLIDIASAKPTKQELELVKHFGINEIFPNEHFSAGKFFEIYKKAKDFCIKEQKPLLITGGSGFYLKSMLDGLSPDVPKCDIEISKEEIYKLAQNIDNEFVQKFSKNDSYRLEKWYQIYKFSNDIPTKWLKENTTKPIIKDIDIFEIFWEREDIRQRIKIRTKKMIENGLIDEAKFLFDKFDSDLKPLKSIGLQECNLYLKNEINIDELENLIFIHTSQLAKRQKTFNRSSFLNRISGDFDFIKDKVCEKLSNN
ncbi:tRNA (adenosine(37)-N6)-dimethylallyltransferase MiaA [Campylobacter pinnipediorum subsp. pinnipediorum]|uniref:tRNA dimethylallyltransferase n=1 Tax=Campylobacter pinnipediorum subsp. pinnipediorum TaxID=1660067 RepID=A0AAX0LA72_9BACT|nr:tRNA (adenosine(37)-N6)-dimethylallyltransferase MiaA [Campylobacter pinnipediorum]OPA78019.1 tRNA (adenosine(37)-N6)-dimethylallyltransferase MiaA [Campylobacter pinnipediorum subsp. pinnipediorum]